MSLLRFSFDPLSITSFTVIYALGIMLMLMGFIYYYFYSNSSSSATKKQKSSSEPKIMVSIQKRFKYDVFISFRGEDTRKNFVDHLYQALNDKGIYTYKDDEKIQKGKRISDDLFQSIEDSTFYIIVFSKNYASSSWCLEELVKIMKCHKMNGHTAYPVFYDVEPTEVRNQSGSVKKAFSKNKNKEAAEKWREALKEATDLASWELKNTLDGHEAKFIQKIVQEISLELNSFNFGFDEKLVGMKTRVKDVVTSLEAGTDEVRMIGIKGMGGAGKTTTARAVFDHVSNDFEAKSFVENVREVSKDVFGLKKLQEQVLSDVLNEKVTVNGVFDGKNMMKRRMCSKKVLLVLDDVDHIDQLKALAGESEWFKKGSRILITTRDEQVLVAHKVHVIRDIALLSEQEAICLFSRHAFETDNPVQGFEKLSENVVRYAAGLPLTVAVLGSLLYRKNMDFWKSAIERLEDIPLKDTLEKLKLSYDGLEDDYKEIFLDIVCILKGQHRKYAIRVLECCGFHARIGLEVLEQRSLITISNYGVLGMHDHIEEMGKHIIRHEHLNEPNKHSQLWIREEIEGILAKDEGTKATRCLKFYMSRGNVRNLMEGLGKMTELRYLELNLVRDFDSERDDARLGSDLRFVDTNQCFTNSLKYLKCTNYPFLYLPKTFQANNLVGLEMESSRSIVQLWEDGENKVLKNLKYLSLDKSNLTTFDFRITPNLESLSLKYSSKLKELRMPDTCQKLKQLKHLNISESELRSFDLGLTPNLEKLSLKKCAQFEKLHVSTACPNLKFLNLRESRLRNLDLELLPNLQSLDLKYCKELVEINGSVESLESSGKLEELFMPVCCQKLKYPCVSFSKLRTFDLGLTPNLVALSLEGCAQFEKLHVSTACPNLKFLNLERSRLRNLDLELIPNLESLDLRGCDKLVKINGSVECLKRVVHLNLSGCLGFEVLEISREPKVNRFSATFYQKKHYCNLPKLRFDCRYEESLPSSVGNIEKLMPLVLCTCTDFKKFSDTICSLQGLKKLELSGNIQKFPKDLGQLECLEELCLSSTQIKHLPDSICMLKRLISLRVYGDLLEKLPEDLDQLECLERLYVSSKKIEYLPDRMCVLKRLKLLDVGNCCCLGKLPKDIGKLESLERLYLWGTKIKHLPDSICKLKHLKFLNLSLCDLLEELPENLGRLECLKKLDIISTGISDLPQSIFGLKGLRIAASQELLQKYAFPSEIKTITSHIWSVNKRY